MNDLRFYEKIEKFSLFYDYYDYVDRDQLSAELFKDQPVKAYFVSMEFNSDSPYKIIRIRVPKKYRLGFILLIQKLPVLMYNAGYTEYRYEANKMLNEKKVH